MNRLKLWLFALIVLALAALGLRWLALDLRRQAVDGIDRQLLAAQARAEAAAGSQQAELAAQAAQAAQDGALGAALRADAPAAPEPPPAPGKPRRLPPPPAQSPEQLDTAVDQAAAGAVAAAQAALGGAATPGREVLAASRDGLARKTGDADALAFLQEAMDHKVRRGFAALGGKLFAGAAVPVGDLGALAVFAPVDTAWANAAVAGTGATLILSAPGLKPVASGRPADIDALTRAAPRTLAPADGGVLGTVDVSPPGLRVVVPPVRSFLGALPGDRVAAKPLSGVKDGRMVLALATRAALAPLVKAEWYEAAALALVLLLALVFGFLVKPTEVLAPVPPALLEAARKIERGDFTVRVPSMSGRVGTVAAALNKAAEAAQAAPPAVGAPGALDSAFYAGEQAAVPPSDPFAILSRGPRMPPVGEAQSEENTARLDGGHLGGAAFEAAPAAPPPPVPATPEPAFPPAPERVPPLAAPPPQHAATGPVLRPAPEPLPAAPTPAPPAPTAAGGAVDEEQHWRDVFRDFVRTRGECGETAEGLTYDRFRQKLETNKAALVAKYGCRTVRFQVYVKEGKAALKATPVR